MKAGWFISLEGGEGAGKSTQAKALADWLKKQGHQVVITREPGGSDGAEAIRELILHPRPTAFAPSAMLLLFLAARADHLHHTILPALAEGAVVICDRFQDSTSIYQGVASGLGYDYCMALYHAALGSRMPDATIWLDLPPELGLERAAASGKGVGSDRFEAASLSFHCAIRQGFQDLAEREPKRVWRVDATLPPEQVTATITRLLARRFGWQI